MTNTLIEKLRALPDSQLLEAIASRDVLTILSCKLRIDVSHGGEYSPEQLIVEIISDVLNNVIADGLNRLDVILFYHVMVEALDNCGQFLPALKC